MTKENCAHMGTQELPDGRRECLYCGKILPKGAPIKKEKK